MKIGKFLKRAGAKIVENKLGITIGGAAVAAGTAGIVNPDVLELIPENLRGYAVLAVVGVLCFERVKSGIVEIINAIQDDEAPQ
jgi:hypothetical protein